MLKHRRENKLIHALVCWKCHGRAGPNHFALEHGGATCGMCGNLNPLANLRRMPLIDVTGDHQIVLFYVPRDGYNVHALHVDCKTVLGPWTHINGDAEALVRLMRYLGATDEQIAIHETHRRAWNQGSSALRLLPNRRNLLRINYKLL